MGLYFYTSLNVMFEYLERNLIAPEGIVHDPHGYRTVGTAADCLFVTHHRLNRDARMQGVGPGFEYPITIAISDPQDADGLAILVKTGPSGEQYLAAPLSEYDEASCVGAYLIGEIPWSRVEKVYYDTAEERTRFLRPSADYWYPTDRYDILPDAFTEEWSFTPDTVALRTALQDAGVDLDAMQQRICDRERMRAGVLGAVNGTSPWEMGEYRFNIDPVIQTLLGLDNAAINAVLPHYTACVSKPETMASTDLVLFGRNGAECADEQSAAAQPTEKVACSINQQIYDIIVRAFRGTQLNHHRTPAEMTTTLHEIEEMFTAVSADVQGRTFVYTGIAAITALITGAASRTPEEIMATCPVGVNVLGALLYVAKNPNSYEDLIRSFDVYHVDQQTRRRAMVLWGELNGLYGIPGVGCNKDNRALWQFIESYVAETSDAQITLSVSRADVTIQDGRVLGASLWERQNITAEDIRQAILSTSKERLDDRFYEKLLDAATARKKGKKKDYLIHAASVHLPEIKRGDELTDDILRRLRQLIDDGKDKNAVPNRERLFEDYVQDAKVFAGVYEVDPEYWRSAFAANKSQL